MENQIALRQNSALQTQESPHSKIGDVETFKIAATGRKLKHVDVERITEALRLIFVKVGLRAANFPNEAEKAVLINFIYNNYGNHTTDEILLAFDLAILGKLDFDDKANGVNHFENFTCVYLAQIMTAYRKWAVNQAQMVKTPLPSMLLKNSITTQEEKLADIADWENRKHVDIHHVPPYLYDYLVEFEKINPTTGDKWDAMKKAADLRKTHLYNESLSLRKEDIAAYNDFMRMHQEGKYTGDEPARLKLLAKKVMIIDYLNTIPK